MTGDATEISYETGTCIGSGVPNLFGISLFSAGSVAFVDPLSLLGHAWYY